jgi:hypothetical protein
VQFCLNIPLRWKDRQTESIVMHPNEIIESFFLHHWQPRTINVKRLKQNVESPKPVQLSIWKITC